MTRPNVLFIVVDCLRYDLTRGPDRPVVTPTLDALAERGTVFEQTIASSSTTVPSLATMLTGVFPFVHGVRALQGDRLGGELRTLPEVFAAQGYHTIARVTGPLLAETGVFRGFADHQWRRHEEYLDGTWGAELRRTLAQRSLSEPWFLLLHLWEAHWPRRVPRRFRRSRYGRTLYEQSISALDAQLADLLSAVPDGTLVALTGDHGELHGGVFDDPRAVVRLAANVSRALWRAYRINLEARVPRPIRSRLDVRRSVGHGVPGHGFHVYDFLVRVPWIIAGPGVPAGRTVAAQTRHTDIAATLLDLAGIPAPDQFAPSLADAVRGAETGERLGYAEAPGVPRVDRNVWITGLRARGLKYAVGPYNTAIPEQLFDLRTDPLERDNIANRRPDELRWMRNELNALLNTPRPFSGSQPLSTEDESRVALRLRELGYLED